MIMISSKAGQRLARAKVLRDALHFRHSNGEDCWPELRDAGIDVRRAAEALADELIADNHHTGEGD